MALRSALLAAILSLATAASAHAQIGDVLRRGRDALGGLPSLSSFLEGDPPVTTSLDDALTELPWLDGYDPGLVVSLDGMPMDAEGRYHMIPGAYAFAAQSYCLKAGTHGPGGGEGYAYAPLAGPKAPIVRQILRGSAAHPDIPQHDIQTLLWAIIARTKPSDMPRPMLATAAQLLTPREIASLEGGALGLVPEPLMRRAMEELPPFAREVFVAEARIRSTLAEAGASYDELERVAVLAGSPPDDPEGRPVPEGRWSYHSDGVFLRFDPSGYPSTTTTLVVPAAHTIVRNGGGAVTEIGGPLGDRLVVERDAAGAPSTLRLLQPDGLEPEVAWPASPADAGPDVSSWSVMLDRVLGRGTNAGALPDLARIERAIGAEGGAAAGQAQRLVTEAWMFEFCRLAGACGGGGAPAPGGDGDAGWRADGPVAFDPTGTVAVPGNRGRQRLGQSPRCNGEDPTGEDGTGDPIEDGLTQGMQGAGVTNFNSDHIGVRVDHPGAFYRFSIRLDANGCPLPQHECIFEGIDQGNVPPGSQVGAKTMAFGAVQIAGSKTRVNARFVDVETGQILESYTATVDGNDEDAVAEAAEAAFNGLGMTCDRAKGLQDQHDR